MGNIIHIDCDKWEIQGNFIVFTNIQTPTYHKIIILPSQFILEIRITNMGVT